jgi:hypothetical protein
MTRSADVIVKGSFQFRRFSYGAKLCKNVVPKKPEPVQAQSPKIRSV